MFRPLFVFTSTSVIIHIYFGNMPGAPTEQADGSSNGDDKSRVIAENGIQNNQPPAQQPVDGQVEAPVREITQTDRLNKRLLMSFLSRMNAQEMKDREEGQDKSDEEAADNDSSFD